jgi:translocation protein SEC63
LSREKHPDKNPDNPDAVEEFIQITKAYTIMTDEKARENFLKYGNPDGKGSMAVGIALPKFLQDVDYQIQVLCAFFILIIFVVPGFFLSQIKSNEKDVGGVDIDNRKVFTDMINENMLMKHIPGIMAYSCEFSQMKVRSKEELDILKKIKENDIVKDAIPKPNDKRGPPQVKPICLLVGHMLNLLEE